MAKVTSYSSFREYLVARTGELILSCDSVSSWRDAMKQELIKQNRAVQQFKRIH